MKQKLKIKKKTMVRTNCTMVRTNCPENSAKPFVIRDNKHYKQIGTLAKADDETEAELEETLATLSPDRQNYEALLKSFDEPLTAINALLKVIQDKGVELKENNPLDAAGK